MEDTDNIPWSTILGFLLILTLGMILPFVMEYRSRESPNAERPPRQVHAPILDDRNAGYCPACGSKLYLRSWRTEPQGQAKPSPLTLKTLKDPAPGFLDRGARTPPPSDRADVSAPDL